MIMGETSVSISLHNGIRSKTFAAEVTGRLGQPLKGVEVMVRLDGDCSLASDYPQHSFSAATDGLGRVAIALNRPPGQDGDIEGQLKVACPVEEGDIHMRFVCMTPEPRQRN
jgi:hypothetical protein